MLIIMEYWPTSAGTYFQCELILKRCFEYVKKNVPKGSLKPLLERIFSEFSPF